jgi:hypothetical protein
VDSVKGALPRQSWKTEGYCTWTFEPSVLPSAYLSEQLRKFNKKRAALPISADYCWKKYVSAGDE